MSQLVANVAGIARLALCVAGHARFHGVFHFESHPVRAVHVAVAGGALHLSGRHVAGVGEDDEIRLPVDTPRRDGGGGPSGVRMAYGAARGRGKTGPFCFLRSGVALCTVPFQWSVPFVAELAGRERRYSKEKATSESE